MTTEKIVNQEKNDIMRLFCTWTICFHKDIQIYDTQLLKQETNNTIFVTADYLMSK